VNGCTSLPGSTIAAPKAFLLVTASSADVSCGQTTGTITVTASNGSSPYTYSKDGGTTYQPSNVFTNLAAGNYTIKVKDAGGCTVDAAVTIKQISSTLAATANAADISGSQTTGTITIIASNGSLPYTYSKDGTSYQSSNLFTNLSAGSYTIKVKDGGGCTADVTVSIKQVTSTLSARASAPEISCGQTSGSVTIIAANGTAPYSYSINAGNTYQTSNIFNNLAASNYTIRVKDSDGTSVDITVIVKQASTLPNIKINNPARICSPKTVDLTLTDIIAGSETGLTYTYFQDSIATSPLTNASAVNKSGKYFIKGTKPDGCFSIQPVTVAIYSKAQNNFNISPDNAICYNSSFQLSASGGTSYTWQPSPSLSNPNISNPIATPTSNIKYSVTIKDSTCNDSTVLTTSLTILPLPTINASKTNDVDCSINTTQLNATGGKNYLWQNGNSLNNNNVANPIAKPTSTTTYVVKGTDNNGCINSDTVTVKVNYDNKSGSLMPTVFTPNGDGLNDCFGLKFWGTVTKLDFSIYNRFGQKIFSTNDVAKCWDGTFKGVSQNIGVYVYVIKASTNCGEVNKKGTFTLIR
jgi:gliding motility-associated-like protein